MICTLNGKLLAITAPSSADFSVSSHAWKNHLPSGARHDVYTFRFHRLERFLDDDSIKKLTFRTPEILE